MNLFVLTLNPLIPLEAVTKADKSLDFFIDPLHLGQVFSVDIDNYFGLDCIKRFYKTKKDSDHMLLTMTFLYTPKFIEGLWRPFLQEHSKSDL
jgi:hypothetical protein